MPKKLSVLDLSELGEPPGYPALTVARGAALAEAAAVCLENQEHKSGKTLRVFGQKSAEYRLTWPSITKQMQQSDSLGLPAFVCVVEFGTPQAHFVKR